MPYSYIVIIVFLLTLQYHVLLLLLVYDSNKNLVELLNDHNDFDIFLLYLQLPREDLLLLSEASNQDYKIFDLIPILINK